MYNIESKKNKKNCNSRLFEELILGWSPICSKNEFYVKQTFGVFGKNAIMEQYVFTKDN